MLTGLYMTFYFT